LTRRTSDRTTIRPATPKDIEAIAPLFDAYRQFYEQPPDLPASRRFLEERLSRNESKVLVAEKDGAAVGFTQLYPLFSSVSLGPVYLLNDLFVQPTARRHGVGERLLEASRSLGTRAGIHYLELSTAVDNPAQRLYEKTGWTLDREFLHYELLLRGTT
jgi:ribosomal protein S18 acetylase RimI-like enzyme